MKFFLSSIVLTLLVGGGWYGYRHVASGSTPPVAESDVATDASDTEPEAAAPRLLTTDDLAPLFSQLAVIDTKLDELASRQEASDSKLDRVRKDATKLRFEVKRLRKAQADHLADHIQGDAE